MDDGQNLQFVFNNSHQSDTHILIQIRSRAFRQEDSIGSEPSDLCPIENRPLLGFDPVLHEQFRPCLSIIDSVR